MGDQIEPLAITGGSGSLHQSVAGIMQFFELNEPTTPVGPLSQSFSELAWLVANGPQNTETTVALRKLLEARDCAARAAAMKP